MLAVKAAVGAELRVKRLGIGHRSAGITGSKYYRVGSARCISVAGVRLRTGTAVAEIPVGRGCVDGSIGKIHRQTIHRVSKSG